MNNLEYYLNLIKERANKILKNPRILIFGSYVKGNFTPTSDIDILIISEELEKTKENPFKKAEVLEELLKDFEHPHPFEIHLTTPETFENWYKNFIKEDYKEI